MKQLKLTKALCFIALVFLTFQGCETQLPFSRTVIVEQLPSEINYTDVIGLREFSRVETHTPTYDSNGRPIYFEIESIRKGDEFLDESFINTVTIINPFVYDVVRISNGQVVGQTEDLTNAGKIIIPGNNPFSNGDYYFSIKGTTTIDGEEQSKIYEDALYISIGPKLVQGMSYCPFKYNFTSTTDTSVAPEVFAGNTDVRYELASDTDKLIIDTNTGIISVNPNYSIGDREDLTPTINVISNISDEVVPFEGTVTVVLSTTPVTFDLETNYFFFPALAQRVRNTPEAGGVFIDGISSHTVETADYTRILPTWSKRGAYRTINNAAQMLIPNIGNSVIEQEILDVRNEAGVAVQGLEILNNWGQLFYPFETWLVMKEVALSEFSGCYDTKMVFWIRQSGGTNIKPLYAPNAPVPLDVNITNAYTGDVFTTNWTSITSDLTWSAPTVGPETYTGDLPYPFSASLDNSVMDATDLWIKCELDLAPYKDSSSFVVGFKSKTFYDEDTTVSPGITHRFSDFYYVATEKQ